MIVTISLEDLLAKAGLAETADGSQLTTDQLLRIADEADIWPTIIDRTASLSLWADPNGSPPKVKPWH